MKSCSNKSKLKRNRLNVILSMWRRNTRQRKLRLMN